MRRLFLCLTLLALALGATNARATEDPVPASARVIETSGAAEKGAFTSVFVEILSRPGAVVEDVRLIAGDGWAAAAALERPADEHPADLPKALSERNLDRRVYELTALASDPTGDWQLEYLVDGHRVVERVDPTPERHADVLVAAAAPLTAVDDPSKFVRPAPAALGAQEREREPAALAKATRDIRVKGRIQYRRMPDGVIMGADGVTVKIHDEEGTFVTNLFTTTTDVNGDFDVTFSWDDGDLFDPEPDILIEVELANAYAQVRSTSVTSENYKIRQHYFPDYTGNFIDIGTMMPSDPIMQGALNIVTVITRSWRWYADRGYTMPQTTFRAPNDRSFFRPFDGVIYLSSAWDEGTMMHEYGHRWVDTFAQNNDPDYCNGICGGDEPRCKHCGWCQEDIEIAWTEGYPDFLGDFVPKQFASIYATGAANSDDFEQIFPCGDPESPAAGGLDDPYMTEGFVAAMLVDLVDTNDENDPATTTWADQMSMPVEEVLLVADLFGGLESATFLQALYTRIKTSGSYTSQDIADFWETGANNSYELDVSAPGNPTSYGSTTHTEGVSSRANWPAFWWSTPFDDASGIAGYGISISPFPAEPAATMDIGPVNGYQTETPLSPGSYYLNLKTVDRSGKWASGFISIGPIIILSPEPIDFQPTVPEFWAGPLVPRPDQSGSSGTVLAPTTLVGGGSSYLNYAFRNDSPSSVIAPDWVVEVRLDDFRLRDWDYPMGVVATQQIFLRNDSVGVTVPGGRHTLSLVLDAEDDVGESDDEDNRYGKQWVWSPEPMPAVDTVSREAIVYGRSRGWPDIVSAPLWYNADGFRMQTAAGDGWWKAVTVTAVSEDIDYDARLHAPSTGAQDGFTSYSAWSGRPAGKLDVLFTNRNNVGSVEYDVGVINNHPPGTGVAFELGFFQSSLIPYDSDITVSFADQQHVALRETYIDTDELGSFSAILSVDPAEGPISALWLDASTTVADMHDFTALATTDSSGHAELTVDVSTAGWYCLVLYREPFREATLKRAGPLTIGLRTGATPPNGRPYEAAGWAAPLVPRASADGTPSSVPAPASLLGDAASTYLNLAFLNDSVALAPALNATVRVDGSTALSLTLTNLAGGNPVRYNHPNPVTVLGGRHTLALKIDPNGVIEELREDDNDYGAQWVFAPTVLTPDVAVTRAAPPDRDAGHDDITVTVTVDPQQGEGEGFELSPEVFPNCDGVRMPSLAPNGDDGQWVGVAAMPGFKSNVDLRLHEISSDASSGFDEALTGSFWPEGQSDYALINLRGQNPRAFDVGVLRSGDGLESYTVHTARSSYLGADPVGEHGPFAMGPDRILDLHEVELGPGIWILELRGVSGAADLGLSVHPTGVGDDQRPFLGKSDTLPGGRQWQAPAGESEYVTVEVGESEAGYHCIAVWKPSASALPASAEYQLVLRTGATATDDAPLARSGELAVHPNPFNPRTVVSFRLVEREIVTVDVFNLRGARVRRLADEVLGAGRHEFVFDGVDDAGRRLATGTYLVQLRAESGLQETEKLTLLK